MFIDSWKEITGDQEILSSVQGCEIKFKSMPHQLNPPHPFNMSKEEETLVDLEVQNLLAKGARGGFELSPLMPGTQSEIDILSTIKIYLVKS